RGKLKIFFGAAAGVGKTYAMLEAARERRSEGVDVVVGWVETHGRAETAALLEGLAVLPPRQLNYKGVILQEFDLDGALQRRPALILVDELAHSNAAGSRHPKRWQDVDELLEAGINVYSTLNVQHLESLNDDVGQISGIRVRETVPDTIFENADEIGLVDLPPDELLNRLKEGKVYLPEQAKRASANFFRKGNLIALRELALRQATQRVDAQMQLYREDHAIREVWYVAERVLVCVGPTPMAERLIRAGKRFAAGLRAEWIVMYVETPELQHLPAEQRDAVLRMLKLAEELGAETVALSATNMSAGIIEFARERNITKIVMGKPSRRGWKRWLMGSVVDSIISEAHNINVYLMGSPQVQDSAVPLRSEGPLFRQGSLPGLKDASVTAPWHRYQGYFWSVLVTAISTLLAYSMVPRFELDNIVIVYLLGVVLIAMRFGKGPSIVGSALAVAAFDFLFVKPYHSFSVADAQYLVTFGGMVAVAFITSHLMDNVRYQAKVAGHRERRATLLYALSKELADSHGISDCMGIAVRYFMQEFGGRNVILLPDEEGRIHHPRERAVKESLQGTDLGVAQWVYDHNEVAGKGTNTLAGSKAVYFPMAFTGNVMGVLAIEPANLRRIFLPEQRKLLETIMGLVIQTAQRHYLADQAKSTLLEIESERLRNSLLTSISHDLRTPLATIVGSASTLSETDSGLTERDRQELNTGIYEEALRMTTLVNNILDMAKLEAGAIKLRRDWYLIEEIIGTVLLRLDKPLEGRPVKVIIRPTNPPMIHVDSVMIEQVLVNLLENAIRYTPPGSPIDITAERTAFAFTLSVADRGPGIPQGKEKHIFEKFVRGSMEGAQSGSGLGLAICKAIVEAHGGWIEARNRGTGGAEFSLGLSMPGVPPPIAPERQEPPEA
ncbi:MAG: sensor histidine kinase KdpD, partial [Methylococcaceae bacterium]|nr:sensor histidine kinase KdpD [Methylococcaceae bacterium]